MRNNKPKQLDVRHLTNIMRDLKFKSHSIVENYTLNEENELTPQEIKQEEENFEKSVPDGIVTIVSATKNDKILNLTGYLKISEDTINFDFKLDKASISNENLSLNDTTVKIINDIYNYYKSWKESWTQQLNISDNQ